MAIRDISERKRAEKALQDASAKLSASVAELERHDRDMTLVNEMGDLLQSCLTTDEAYQVISQYGRRLFPADSGAVFIEGAVSVFGSARVTSTDPAYLAARQVACQLGQAGLAVITGGGAGGSWRRRTGVPGTPARYRSG